MELGKCVKICVAFSEFLDEPEFAAAAAALSASAVRKKEKIRN